MNALSTKSGGAGQVDMVKLPKVDHSFRDAVLEGGLATLLFNHCYAAAETYWSTAAAAAETRTG
jgi:hypothetical protein